MAGAAAASCLERALGGSLLLGMPSVAILASALPDGATTMEAAEQRSTR